jgi:aryl-alcohol dehydrogenase-like predicted oxidoreductase
MQSNDGFWHGNRFRLGLTSGIRFYEGVLESADYDLLERLTQFAGDRGHTLLELAIGWLASQPAIGSVMTGATRVEQIEQNAKAGDPTYDVASFCLVCGPSASPSDISGLI